MPADLKPVTPEVEGAPTTVLAASANAPDSSPTPSATECRPGEEASSPTLTLKVNEARLQVEVSQTVKEGDDYYKLGGTLELPLDTAGRYDVAQLEGALVSLTVVTARLNSVISQAWQIKQRALRAERQQLTAKLATALQGIGVPSAEMQAVLVEFFGGLPASPVELQTTLAKITAMRNTTERPQGWRWRVPVLPHKNPPGAPAGVRQSPSGSGAATRASVAPTAGAAP